MANVDLLQFNTSIYDTKACQCPPLYHYTQACLYKPLYYYTQARLYLPSLLDYQGLPMLALPLIEYLGLHLCSLPLYLAWGVWCTLFNSTFTQYNKHTPWTCTCTLNHNHTCIHKLYLNWKAYEFNNNKVTYTNIHKYTSSNWNKTLKNCFKLINYWLNANDQHKSNHVTCTWLIYSGLITLVYLTLTHVHVQIQELTISSLCLR